MRSSKKFFKLQEKDNGEVFCSGVFIQPLGENKIIVKNKEHDISPNFQKKFANKKLTTKSLDNDEKETVFDILNKVGSYDINHTKRLNSNRVKDALCNLPKTIPKI